MTESHGRNAEETEPGRDDLPGSVSLPCIRRKLPVAGPAGESKE